jgi:hypothetical protein
MASLDPRMASLDPRMANRRWHQVDCDRPLTSQCDCHSLGLRILGDREISGEEESRSRELCHPAPQASVFVLLYQ